MLTAAEESLVRQLIAQISELLNLAENEVSIISKLGAQKKNLGQLTAATSVSETDLMFIRQGTTDKNAPLSILSDFFSGSVSLTIPGYKVFTDGLILQWGFIVQAGQSTVVHDLPIPFPNAALASFVSKGYLISSTNEFCVGSQCSTTQITIRNSSAKTDVQGINWLVIGY